MNREGAETYLRLLGEAGLREPLAPEVRQPWSGARSVGMARMMAVATALTAVGAVDTETAEEILADFDLAVNVRRAGQPQAGQGVWPAGRPGPMRFAAGRQLVRGVLRSWPARSVPGVAQPPGGTRAAGGQAGGPAQVPGGARAAGGGEAGGGQAGGRAQVPGGGEAAGGGGGDDVAAGGGAEPFERGELYLISYAHTGSGARFTVVWRMRDPYRPPRPGQAPMPPFEKLSATDDRGGRYRVQFAGRDSPEWTGRLSLHPEPPDDIRWIDICGPGGETRVSLDPAAPGGAMPAVREVTASPGEHLLNLLAVRLLTIAPEFPHDLRLQLAAVSPGPLSNATIGLGDVIAALEAADALPPLSPVPGRLAALCASLRVSGHGITAPPARDLPEPWLSMLAHYHRRKPDIAPPRDGYATLAAVLPELDGVRLALLSLDNSDGSTVLNVLANGLAPDGHGAASAVDMHFSLSIWVHDSGGRWHATRPSNWHWADSECVLTLHLVPPLAESATWVDVLAVGQSAEVRVRLPLDW